MAAEQSSESLNIRTPAGMNKIPAEWNWALLDSICDGIYDCPHSTPELTLAGPYVARTQDVITGIFRADAAAHVSPETYKDRIKRAEPRWGDLLYSREGTYFGIAAEVPSDVQVCLGQRMVLIRPNAQVVDHRFLRYWLNSPVMSAHVHGRKDGSVAERLNLPTIRSLPTVLPDLREQRRIAAVLGTLDDKIAVTEGIAATARSLGHAKGRHTIHGISGRTGILGDFVEVTKGLSYRSADLVPGGGYLVTLKCIDRTGAFQQRGLKPFSGIPKPSQLVQHGDVVVAQTDLTQQAEVLGRSARIIDLNGNDRLIASLDLAVVRPKSLLTREYIDVLFSTREFREHALSYANGTTVLHLGSRALPDFTFTVPDAEIVTSVTQVTRSLFDVAVQAEREASSLATLRDTLLPQLVSGRFRVSDAEKIVEDHA
ncbi:restriction endonuclease subunit S [Streptomyces sp. NPDC013012]|uniref:restriction endonuclease subunit S n=1 Tax=Streptomyces sp. NPDC013012 TaxID=3364860 RepID=UPI0036C80E4E